MMKRKIIFKPELCMTCHSCALACAEGHSDGGIAGVSQIARAAALGASRTEIRNEMRESGEKLKSVRCIQCKKPKCIEACKSGALSRDADGIILVDGGKCTACWACIDACPFDAAFKDIKHNRPVMCDLCMHLDEPFCVSACPTGALEIEERKEKSIASGGV